MYSKENRVLWGALLLFLLPLASCSELFEPNANALKSSDARGHNAAHIQRIQAMYDQQDTLRVAIIGDTQCYYDEVQDLVVHLNQRDDVDFAVQIGDLTDFGLRQEYVWMIEELDQLQVPWVGVVGNHDLLANGPALFEQMMGPLDDSFLVGQQKFVLMNTNSREFRFNGLVPSMDKAERLLHGPAMRISTRQHARDAARKENVLLLIHVPPFDGDFDQSLAQDFGRQVASIPSLHAVIFGHIHRAYEGRFPEGSEVSYISVPNLAKRSYSVLTLAKDYFRHERYYY